MKTSNRILVINFIDYYDMKKLSIFTTLLLGLFAMTSCDTDRDDNPVLQKPTTFVLNTPAYTNVLLDLDNSSSISLTCNQPNYGFPVATSYVLQVSLDDDMANYTEMSTTFSDTHLTLDANELAVALTNQAVEKGKTEADFPLNTTAYIRARAFVNGVDGTEILSNIVSLNSVYTSFALPAVEAPETLYITGSFNGWNWETALQATQVNGAVETLWHMVFIDESGIKFNTNPAWDGGEIGYAKLNSVDGDLAAEIQANDDGNISSTNPGWYLMIVKCTVVGRDIVYDATFNKPEVWLIGTTTPAASWAELEDGMQFTVPTTADGEFVSPAFANDAAEDSGVRAYVKVPGYDWWKSEFMVFDGKIVYRGNGGDQDRVTGSAGQKLYLNFTAETGRIE